MQPAQDMAMQRMAAGLGVLEVWGLAAASGARKSCKKPGTETLPRQRLEAPQKSLGGIGGDLGGLDYRPRRATGFFISD